MQSLKIGGLQLVVRSLLVAALLTAALAVPVLAQETPAPANGRIRVTTTPGVMTIVQWQDSAGNWNDVTGWRAVATDGTVSWGVEPKDFGKGPFRWVSYGADGYRVGGTSDSFYLPTAGQTVSVHISGYVYQQPSARPPVPGYHPPTYAQPQPYTPKPEYYYRSHSYPYGYAYGGYAYAQQPGYTAGSYPYGYYYGGYQHGYAPRYYGYAYSYSCWCYVQGYWYYTCRR